jgi:SAM-dependent methyltransferase
MPVTMYDPVPDIGYLYDHVPLYVARQDVEFYLDAAKRAGGDVLEIGCGTGRILLPTAQAGIHITGLDGSREMLGQLRRRLANEPADLQQRVTVVEGDARDFDLGRTFALITSPFRVFQHMIEVDDQLGFLRSVSRHLAPGGRFVFDVFNPRFDLMVTSRSELAYDTAELTMEDGRVMKRGYRVLKVHWVRQVSEIEMVWFVTDGPGGPMREYVQPFDMRWFTRSEMEHLAARVGFRVETVYGDTARGPLVDGAPDMIFVLVRA